MREKEKRGKEIERDSFWILYTVYLLSIVKNMRVIERERERERKERERERRERERERKKEREKEGGRDKRDR